MIRIKIADVFVGNRILKGLERVIYSVFGIINGIVGILFQIVVEVNLFIRAIEKEADTIFKVQKLAIIINVEHERL